MNSDLEEIKKLKARYCRLLDTKQWIDWRALFTADFIGDTSDAGGKRIEGGDAFVGFVQTMLGSRTTVHQVHAPEIALKSDAMAEGIWALEDFVRLAPGFDMRGSGHYHEVYEKIEGLWHIKESRLTRLREDIVTPFFSIYISPGIRNTAAKILRRYKRHMES